MPLPNFIIAGETKCGTTSLYDMLVQHPHVLPAIGSGYNTITEDGDPLAVKEIRFFDRYWANGIEWYKKCFPECLPGMITGEGTPMYLYRTQAIQRMAQTIPAAKIIIMLRNPTDRLVSHYHHLGKILPDWYERYTTVQEFWDKAFEGDYYIIDKGIYWRSIQTLFGYYDYYNIHIIRSEDLFTDPQTVYFNLLEFLELEDSLLKKASHSRKNNYNKISSSLREQINEFYKPHNEELELLLEREFQWK